MPTPETIPCIGYVVLTDRRNSEGRVLRCQSSQPKRSRAEAEAAMGKYGTPIIGETARRRQMATNFTAAQTLSRHKGEIAAIVSGVALFGEHGEIDVAYDGDRCDRNLAAATDMVALRSAGYRARIIGRGKCVTVDLTNVGDAFNARFVK